MKHYKLNKQTNKRRREGLFSIAIFSTAITANGSFVSRTQGKG